MQNFWMDTDPEFMLPEVARVCAELKYSLAELEAVYWNEVRPAVSFNMRMLPAPEWAGFELEWLKARVLKSSASGGPFPGNSRTRTQPAGGTSCNLPSLRAEAASVPADPSFMEVAGRHNAVRVHTSLKCNP